jgi:cobalt/nickel transport system permease protein
MNPAAVNTITLSAWQGLVLLGCLLLPVLFALLVLRRGKGDRPEQGGEPDWSIPVIDVSAKGGSVFHSWNPVVKVGVLLPYCFLITSLRSLVWAVLALAVSLVAVGLTGLPWRRPLRRLAAMTGFLVMFLVVLPFTSPAKPGETVLLFPLLDAWPFRLQGLLIALTVTCKAAAIALLMEPMLATAPLATTLHSFTTLGLPSALTQMLLLCHRYLFVFQEEAKRMLRSMRVRGFVARTDLATLRTMGNCLGMLFIRSFERTERIHEAMLSRGYRGVFPAGPVAGFTGSDVVKGVVWGLVGVFLLVLDRLIPAVWP